jgi:hypothetical protein
VDGVLKYFLKKGDLKLTENNIWKNRNKKVLNEEKKRIKIKSFQAQSRAIYRAYTKEWFGFSSVHY